MPNLTPDEFALLKEYLFQCGIWRSDEDAFELFQGMEDSGIVDAKEKVNTLLTKLGVEL